METKLKVLRKSHNLTQEQVAKLVGLSRTGYANIERGFRYPSFKTAIKIKQFFKSNKDDLFDVIS